MRKGVKPETVLFETCRFKFFNSIKGTVVMLCSKPRI